MSEGSIDGQQSSPTATPTQIVKVRHGMCLYLTDARFPDDFTAPMTAPESMMISVNLRGGDELLLSPGSGSAAAPAAYQRSAEGALMAFAEAHESDSRPIAGKRVRHVGIGITPDWFAATGGYDGGVARALQGFSRRHLATQKWQLSDQAILLAEQMLLPARHDPLLHGLYLESQMLRIMMEGFSHLAPEAPSSLVPPLSAREFARVRSVRELIETDDAITMSIDDIARFAGVNTTTLQQQFKVAYGTTIFTVLRNYRMRRARQALQHGASVGQAAFLAGYSSASNFSTAFKQCFGVAPKHARASP